jgi:Tol biopolymer transport system component
LADFSANLFQFTGPDRSQPLQSPAAEKRYPIGVSVLQLAHKGPFTRFKLFQSGLSIISIICQPGIKCVGRSSRIWRLDLRKNAIALLSVLFLMICVQLSGTSEQGAEPASATEPFGPAGFPAWSPDGNHIAFVAEREDSNVDLWVMDSDGQSPLNLTGDFEQISQFFGWSPDSSKIAFSGRMSADQGTDIWLINRDGTEPFNLSAQITTNEHVWHRNPAWSPNGHYIAFESLIEDRTDIIVVDTETFASNNLTENFGTVNDQFSWSPDSQHIAVRTKKSISSATQTWTTPEILVLSIDGSPSRMITGWLQDALDEDIGDPVSQLVDITGITWSPTGEYIAFSARYLTSAEIYLVDSAGQNHLWILGLAEDVTPAWSPDGQKFVYVELYPRSSNSSIYVHEELDVPFAAENLTYYHESSLNLNPRWSPSGDKIVFQSDRAGEFDIWIMDIDGSNPINLTVD